MPITTPRDLIKSSMKLIGALDPHEEPEADEADDALDILNELISSWNTERLLVYVINRQQFNLTSAKQSYTIGTGGDFATDRPDRIERVSILTSNGTLELSLRPRTTLQWQAVPTKGTDSTLPNQYYYEPSYPLGVINYWPIPRDGIPTILYLWNRISRFTGLTDTLTFPDGYVRALRYNLAIELEPEYGRQSNPRIDMLASQSKSRLKAINHRPLDTKVDDGLLGRGPYFDWRTGDPR